MITYQLGQYAILATERGTFQLVKLAGAGGGFLLLDVSDYMIPRWLECLQNWSMAAAAGAS